jgi:hypothetical protein
MGQTLGLRRGARQVSWTPGRRPLEHDDVFVGDEVQGQAGGALFADEVALEERPAGDEVVFGDAGEQRDAAFDGDEAGVGAAGQDL